MIIASFPLQMLTSCRATNT